MSTFKLKPQKTRYVTEIQTLDEMHRKIMDDFKKKNTSLPKKKKRIEYVKNKLKELESKNKDQFTSEDIKSRSSLKSEIEKLEDEIYDIENNISEIEYYSKTDDLLMEYYDILENEKEYFYDQHPELHEEKIDEEEQLDKLDILNMMKNKNRKTKKTTRRRKKRVEFEPENSILNLLGVPQTTSSEDTEGESKKVNRAELLDQYKTLVDNEYGYRKIYNSPIKDCTLCGEPKTLIQSEGIYVCQCCGEVEMIIIEAEKPSYKDSSTPDKPGYPYKRQNHYAEWLSQFQAKESTEIPKDVYDLILEELRKNRFYNLKDLNIVYMKKILKKLNLAQYYEHATHIISKLSGLPPPTISRETEEKLRLMFKQIQTPFEKHCPATRVNFLSYSYVLHKFCQLLELDDFIKCFPLLKSREKLRQQDKIWQKICEDLHWEFIPSV